MKMITAGTGLFLLTVGIATSLSAGDATTSLFDRLDKGDCLPSSLTGSIWTITTGPDGTHDELNWGDQLVFEQLSRATEYDDRSSFRVWKNGAEWKSTGGWNGACVHNDNLGIYVVTGTIELEGCLHELAFGRLDHDDRLGSRIEVIFEHAGDGAACDRGHGRSGRHPGHAHGDDD